MLRSKLNVYFIERIVPEASKACLMKMLNVYIPSFQDPANIALFMNCLNFVNRFLTNLHGRPAKHDEIEAPLAMELKEACGENEELAMDMQIAAGYVVSIMHVKEDIMGLMPEAKKIKTPNCPASVNNCYNHQI